MARIRRSASIRTLAEQRVQDDIWGMPESPEFSAVQRLMNEFQSHASQEERWLSSYREMAKESSDRLASFLLDLIAADEERHHELLARMISKLKDELAWTHGEGAARKPVDGGAERKRLLAAVERFLEAERKGIAECERLKKASRSLNRDVFELLYGMMVHDSHKHLAILEFLRRRLQKAD
jgi:rubrerythrin